MDPFEEYTKRRDSWRAEHAVLQRQFIRIGNARLALGFLEVLLACLVFGAHWISVWSLLVPVIAFIPLAVRHARVMRRRTLAERAVRYYERGLTRLSDRWAGTGATGERFRDASHIYAEDLDLFGKGSLFELLSTARIAEGERTLANWLFSPASRSEALARQEAARELSSRVDLRQDLALLGEDVPAAVHAETVQQWGSAPAVRFPAGLRIIAPLLAAAGIATLLAFLAQTISLWPFAAILALDLILMRLLRERTSAVTESVNTPAQGLHIFSLVLQRLEQEQFTSARLARLRARLDVDGTPASRRIARLQHWMDWLDSSDHLLVRALRPVLLWREQIAMGIEAWRRVNGHLAADWLNGVAEFEALASLAALAYERPGWAFPALVEASAPCFEAEALQHPLMSRSACVPNDLRLGGDLRLLIVSGSNMSGKSTLLRSAGLNCVLAWAGAPVAARTLRISALQTAASIRVTDSLQDNRSRFFAEILRIGEIVKLTERDLPVLFLLDELLSGTNSHDRRIGAAGIVRKLVEAGAIGMMTTHDLALADIEHDLGSAASNVHFDDQIQEGRVSFDYRLRPGIVTHSNALELMRAVGLAV